MADRPLDPGSDTAELATSPEGGTSPVTAGRVAAPQSRARWIVAGLVVAAVVLGTVAAFVFLAAKPLPEALRYAPADSAIVVELRPELPGDQRQHLGNFLAHFPGFADQSILDTKIDEALDRLIRGADNGAIDYATQVKPLLAGAMTVSMSSADLGAASSGGTPASLLVVATTDGKATCASITGTSVTKGDVHRGIQLVEIGAGASCAADGRFMLFGSAAAIGRGIDAHLDGKGIDGNTTFRSAREQLTGDQLALLFVNGKDLTSALASAAPSLGIDAGIGADVPEWAIAGLRVLDDALQVEAFTPPVAATALPSGTPTDPPPAKSHFATLLPGDAFGFVEVHGAGANVQRLLAQLKADPAQAETVAGLEEALSTLGGVQNLTSWIEDLGVAGVPVGDSAGGVLLLRGTDSAAAKSHLDQIRNLLVLASTGSDITLTSTDHDGVTITKVDLGELGPTLEAFGVPLGSLPAGTRLSFSMATRDDIVMLGVGDGVLEAILDVKAASSLATAPGYSRAIDLAGSPNDVEAYLALDGLAPWIEARFLAGTDLDAYGRDTRPYVEHLAGVAASTVTTSTGTRSRIILTVK